MRKIIFLGIDGGKNNNASLPCIQISPNAVIDAGSLHMLDEIEPVLEHIFVTHAHLDHICDIPFYIDSNFTRFEKPLKIYGGKKTIKALKEHIFNDIIWPKFQDINLYQANEKLLKFIEIEENQEIQLPDIKIRAAKSKHTVECFGYVITHKEHSIYFTSDTLFSKSNYSVINKDKSIEQVILDISYPSDMEKLAIDSLHTTPEILKNELKNINRDIRFYAFHLKPHFHNKISEELKDIKRLNVLTNDSYIYFNPKYAHGDEDILNSREILETIFTALSNIAYKTKLNTILYGMSEMVKKMLQAERCTLWIADYDRKEIFTEIAHGVKDSIRIPIDKGIVGKTITQGEPLIINDPYNHPDFDKSVDKNTGFITRSIITIPVYDSSKKIIGVYQALNKLSTIDYAFNQNDLNYLLLAATFTGSFYESFLLNKDLEKTQKEIIYTLASACEVRSQETGNHVKRVALYSRVIASCLGMNDEEVNIIELASTTHDIGKIAIADSILNKPGKLTEDEFEKMKKHAQIGYEVLKHSDRPVLKTAATIAWQHHEKFDGSGYPRGLKGEEIDISARIVAIADVFDAIGSDRVYKKAWPLENCFEYLKKQSGSHFDPRLIKIFFDNVDEIISIRNKYQD